MIDIHAALPGVGGGQTAYGSVVERVNEYPRSGALVGCCPKGSSSSDVRAFGRSLFAFATSERAEAPAALATCGSTPPSRTAMRTARQATQPARPPSPPRSTRRTGLKYRTLMRVLPFYLNGCWRCLIGLGGHTIRLRSRLQGFGHMFYWVGARPYV